MTLPRETLRLLVASVVALPLAAISGAHALSSASLRLAPELAISVFPFNGLAAEKVGLRHIRQSRKRRADRQCWTGGGYTRGRASQTKARVLMEGHPACKPMLGAQCRLHGPHWRSSRCFRKPTQSLQCLSLTPNRGAKIVALASRLNRRELALQGLVLQQKANEGDYAWDNHYARSNPPRAPRTAKAEFFPLLVDCLSGKRKPKQVLFPTCYAMISLGGMHFLGSL